MNRRIALFLAVAAVVILASGCNRPHVHRASTQAAGAAHRGRHADPSNRYGCRRWHDFGRTRLPQPTAPARAAPAATSAATRASPHHCACCQ